MTFAYDFVVWRFEKKKPNKIIKQCTDVYDVDLPFEKKNSNTHSKQYSASMPHKYTKLQVFVPSKREWIYLFLVRSIALFWFEWCMAWRKLHNVDDSMDGKTINTENLISLWNLAQDVSSAVMTNEWRFKRIRQSVKCVRIVWLCLPSCVYQVDGRWRH